MWHVVAFCTGKRCKACWPLFLLTCPSEWLCAGLFLFAALLRSTSKRGLYYIIKYTTSWGFKRYMWPIWIQTFAKQTGKKRNLDFSLGSFCHGVSLLWTLGAMLLASWWCCFGWQAWIPRWGHCVILFQVQLGWCQGWCLLIRRVLELL